MKLTINTYAKLEHLVRAFADGAFGLIAIIGTAGLEKSMLVERICKDARRLSGTLSAFEFYVQLWNNRDRDFIIDDVDQLD